MGIFDERRKELGLKTATTKSSATSGRSGGGSVFERRRAQLNQEREQRRQESIRQAAERVETAAPSPLPSVENQLRTAKTAFTPQSVNRDFRPIQGPPAPTFTQPTGRTIAQRLGLDKAIIGPSVSEIGQAVLTDPLLRGVSRTASLGLGEGAIPERRGEKPLLETAGEFLGYLQPGTAAERIAATALRPVVKNLPRAAQLASQFAGAGALFGTAQETAQELGGLNDQTLGQRALDVGIETAAGGALGALGDVPRVLRNYGQRAAQDVVSGQVGASRAIQQAGDAVTTGRLKVGGPDTYVNRMMSEISPIVTERITPPLENPNELAKWLKPHLGDVSLNEIRKLPYEDMRQLANEVRSNMNTYDVARSVARERGYDLDGILNGNTPNIKNEVERLRMGRVAGAIDAPQNARMALSSNAPEASASAPQAQSNWFSRLFGDQNVGISPFGSNRSDRIVTTEQQVVNNPVINSVRGNIDKTKQTGRAAYQNMVDYLSPLKTINRETYDAAIDSARANNLANTIIRDKFVDNQGNVIGNSLNDIMRNTRGLGKKVDDYLVLRHAITRMRRNERVYDEGLNMTPEKAEELVRTMEQRNPELVRVGQEWDQWNTNILDNAVKEGLISQAARDTMRSQNPNYASMRRQFTTSEKFAQPKWGNGGSAFSGQKAPIKEVSPTGSTRKIVTPLRSAIEQAYAWKNAELRNRVMQEVVKTIQADPQSMSGIATVVKKPSTSFKSLDEALRDGGSEEFLEMLDNDFKSLFKKGASGEDNIVRAMVNGNPVYLKIHNPEAAKALLGMGAEQAGIVLKTMQTLSDATKRGATGLLAPMFAVKSVIGDTVQAAIQSPNALRHMFVDVPQAAISSIGDVFRIPGMRNLAQEFRRAGGEYSALLRTDRRLNTSVSDLRREAPLSPRGIAKGAVNTVKAPFRALEKVADVSENMNRMAAFSRAMRGKERTPQNVRNALNAARESTVNYSRRGAWTREAEAFAPYSNAAMQGMYRMTKAFAKNPVKTIGGISTFVIAPKLYEYAAFNNDPDYQKLPAREKYRNLIVRKNADGSFFKIPMPPEYLAFGAFITDVLNDVVNNDPQAYKGTLDALSNALLPPIPSGALQGATQGGGIEKSLAGLANASVLGPGVSMIANQSFTGAPIVPQRLQNRSKELQFDERTSAVGKWIGEKLKLSPLKVDYLLRSYGGDPARLVLPLTSDVGGGTARNTIFKNFIVDPVFTNTLADDYYSAKEALQRAKADNAAGREFPAWYSDEIYKLATSTAKNAPAKRISELGAEKRLVQGDKTLSAKEKAQKLRDIQAQTNEIYLDVNTKLQEAGVPMPRR